MDVWHIVPVDDLKEHEESEYCECQPSMMWENGDKVIIHNSFDGRELYEINDEQHN